MISSDAIPTVMVVMSLRPRSSNGNRGKNRVAARGSGPYPLAAIVWYHPASDPSSP